MIDVLIVDDMKILRESLKLVISHMEGIDVVGCAANGMEALQLTKELKPSVVLMDLNMPVYSGYDAILEIKKHNSEVKILVLTVEDSEEHITRAFINGADGYVLKDINVEELATAIRRASKNEKYVAKHAFYMNEYRSSLEGYQIVLKDEDVLELTKREKDVVSLVIQGHTNEEISECLGISVGRARNIVTELISKYNVKNRTQLAVAAIKLEIHEKCQ